MGVMTQFGVSPEALDLEELSQELELLLSRGPPRASARMISRVTCAATLFASGRNTRDQRIRGILTELDGI